MYGLFLSWTLSGGEAQREKKGLISLETHWKGEISCKALETRKKSNVRCQSKGHSVEVGIQLNVRR
jgi:hypothetical protein